MKDILELARECRASVRDTTAFTSGPQTHRISFTDDSLAAFAQRIREDEREKAAKVCETLPVHDEFIEVAYNTAVKHCAAAIRRGGDHG